VTRPGAAMARAASGPWTPSDIVAVARHAPTHVVGAVSGGIALASFASELMDEVVCVARDSFCLSASSGQVVDGDQGLFIRDTRVLSRLVLQLNGRAPSALTGTIVGGGAARFCSSSFGADRADDPTLFVDRRRVVAGSMVDDIRLTNYGLTERQVIVELFAAADFAYVFDVKHGRRLAPAPADGVDGGLRFTDRQADRTVTVRPTPPADVVDPDSGRLLWSVTLPPRGEWDLTVAVGFTAPEGATWPTHSWAVATAHPQQALAPPWTAPTVRAPDSGLVALVDRSLTDLASLLVEDPLDPSDSFVAAGSPWYLTLFGRDALWAARMMLPVTVDLAHHTLRVLGRRQGTRHDARTEEAPGKILHEVRHGGLVEHGDLPAVYFGSIDATPLWIVLLSEAWRWGLPDDDVAALLPTCERALEWIARDGDPDGDGFLEYAGSDEGLANQGWKDSLDAIPFAGGDLATRPIALCEVQGYAHDAAVRAAELLDHFGRPGGDHWRTWAADLRERFRAAFWVDDGAGPYAALALDGTGRPVDAVASNMGHLPGTGIVDDAETARIAMRLAAPDMASGWGLRTLSASSPRFNPLSYHGGSVWPHDTVIAATNLALAGHGAEATSLVGGLVEAAVAFSGRLPELYGGEQRVEGLPPLPYPAACRPQAWAAASAVLLLRCLLGLDPHGPQGVLRLRPVWPPPIAPLEVTGLQVGGGELVARIDRAGVWVELTPAALRIEVIGAPRLHDRPGPPRS
jgi:glycogen debranching enzyme